MPPPKKSGHVDPRPEERREKERWEDVERLAEETRKHEEFAHSIADSVLRIQQTINDANVSLDIPKLNDVSRGQSQDPHEAFEDDSDDAGYQQLMERVDNYLDDIPDVELQLSRAEFLAREFGFASLFGAAGSSDVERVMTFMLYPDGFQKSEQENVQQIVDAWRRRSGADLMTAFASRYHGKVAKSPTALDCHMVTLSLIRKLHPLEHGWIWDNKAAFAECVIDLTKGEDLTNGLDLGAFYDRALTLVKEGSYPPAIIAEVARAALAAIAAESRGTLYQRVAAQDVAKVERIGEKLVFVVTDKARGKFVIKFETRLASESADRFAMRQRLVFASARVCLQHVPDIRPLTADEILQLKNFPSDALKKVLAPPADGGQPLLDCSLVLKMGHVDVGKSLMDMIAQAKDKTGPPLPKALASTENMRQLGRMAMFDLLLSNADRFHEPSGKVVEYVNLENIDFRSDGDGFELVPLDNFSIVDRLSLGLEAFASTELPLIKDQTKRNNYSQDAVAWILGEMKITDLPPAALPELQRAFLDGMNNLLADLRSLAPKLPSDWCLSLLRDRLGAVG